jgi:hypothetical protein
MLAFPADVVLQIIDGDALLLKLNREDVFSLNATGARIAELIARGLDVSEIVETLSDEYGAAPDEIARDVDGLVDALVARGLVVVGEAERSS